MLTTRNGTLAVAVALVGLGVCVAALVGFLATIVGNHLPWHPGQSVQDYYLAIGRSYGQGFTVGFFSCFFLTMIAVSIDRWWRRRRAPERAETELPRVTRTAP